MLKHRPTDAQFETALLWLENNEGDDQEREACRAVALWIDTWRSNEMLRQTARQAGVSVATLRRRLAGRHVPVPDEEEN